MSGSGEFYIFRVWDESMIEAGVAPGDLVVIRRQETAENGQIAVVLVDEEASRFAVNFKNNRKTVSCRQLRWQKSQVLQGET